MTVQFYWQIDPAAQPARAEPGLRPAWAESLRDGRSPAGNRSHHYGQIARAAALTAFDGVFIAYRPESDDSQILAATLARLTPGLKLIPEFPASIGSAVYAAKEGVSFQRATGGRLGWALAHDRSPEERRADGDDVSDVDQFSRLEEFLTVARGVHSGTGYSFKGRFFEVANGGFEDPLNRVAFPPVFLQGTQEEQLELSARLGDVHLFGEADLPDLTSHIETLDALAGKTGRTTAYGVRLSVTARELPEDLEGAPAAAITGTYDEVAERLAQLAGQGVTHFVLAAEPSLEEAYRIGQHVLPRVRALLGQRRIAA